MKKIIIIICLVFTGIQITNAQSSSISFNTFRTELSPYGSWVEYPPYGSVWMYNDRGFRPYYNDGYWAYTNLGWTWVSEYDWGWAPFHYGRWIYAQEYGWLWVPGYEWAPAWVSWSRYDNYYGWAPLAPGWGVNSFNSIPSNYWVFAPCQYLNSPVIQNYYLNPTQNPVIIRKATQINNVQVTNTVNYQAGPGLNEVKAITKTPVKPLAISTSAKPGKTIVKGQTLNLFVPDNKTAEVVSMTNQEASNNNTVQTQIQKKPSNPEKAVLSANETEQLKIKQEKQQSENARLKTERELQRNLEIEQQKLQQQKAEQQKIKIEMQQRKIEQADRQRNAETEQQRVQLQKAERQQILQQQRVEQRAQDEQREIQRQRTAPPTVKENQQQLREQPVQRQSQREVPQRVVPQPEGQRVMPERANPQSNQLRIRQKP